MPIQIKTKKLSPWNNDLADQIKVDMLNRVVDEFAKEAKVQLSKLTCDKHPDKISHITIAADRQNTMLIRRRFCCNRFSQKISVKLEGYI